MNTHAQLGNTTTPTKRPRAKLFTALTMSVALTGSGLLFALVAAPPVAAATELNLGTSGQFAVLAGAGVTNTGSTTIQTPAGVRGDVGTFPNNTVTGDASISWIPPAAGSVHKADAEAENAQADNLIAYNAAAGAASDATLDGQLDGVELLTGVYTASSTLNLATNGTVTFNAQNDPDAVFIIKVGSSLTMEVNSTVALTNGAQACHIYWQVSEDATIKANANFVGTVLAENAIVAQSGASFEGRLLAQNASVTLDNNTFTLPGCSAPVVADGDTDSTDVDTDSTDTETDSDSDTTDVDVDTDSTDVVDSDIETDSIDVDTEGGTPSLRSLDTPADALSPTSDDTSLPDTGGSWLVLVPLGMVLVVIGASVVSMVRRSAGTHRA